MVRDNHKKCIISVKSNVPESVAVDNPTNLIDFYGLLHFMGGIKSVHDDFILNHI